MGLPFTAIGKIAEETILLRKFRKEKTMTTIYFKRLITSFKGI
jgi:hypothetical protein